MLTAHTEDPVISNNINRRVLFAGVLSIPMAAPAQASIDPYERVRLDATALAQSLQILHGGTWSTDVDHDARLAICIDRS